MWLARSLGKLSLWCISLAVTPNPGNIGINGLLVSCTFIIWCSISCMNECCFRNIGKPGFAPGICEIAREITSLWCENQAVNTNPTNIGICGLLVSCTFIIECWISCLNLCCRRNLENTWVLLLVFVKSLWKLCLCDAQVKLMTPTLLILVSIDSLYRVLS